MANGVLRIPLSGRSSARRVRAKSAPVRPFVAGEENALGVVAALSKLGSDRSRFNPLVFCGPPGVGKSHLVTGLAVELARLVDGPAAVAQTVAVDFAREFAEALEVQSLAEFHARYRDVDLLVVEDLHLIAGKIDAEQELARTIDAVRDRCGQVLVSMHRDPAETKGMLPALAARLEAGLVVPLAPPGVAARREILADLAAERQVDLAADARDLIAERLSATARQLDAALVRLTSKIQNKSAQIGLADARSLVESQDLGDPLTIADLARRSAQQFAQRLHDVRGPSRRRGAVLARSVGMLLARRCSRATPGEIGQYYGRRDRTTVLHACAGIERRLRDDRLLADALDEIVKLARRDRETRSRREKAVDETM